MRAQGDAPRNALLEWFLETPHSVLLATRSFWEGVDIPGEDLSLVVLDKMPFPTPGDPLHSARMKAVEEAGGSSFGEYMTPLMTLSLKQGFGRLIRRGTDWGVVAILDERLSSKGYGRRARRDLPAAQSDATSGTCTSSVRKDGRRQRLRTERVVAHEPADGDGDSRAWWRCRLLRMQDGRADELTGEADGLEAPALEVFAALQGLRDLAGRMERAKRRRTPSPSNCGAARPPMTG